eukprot:7916584-Alexandrium_andersonii.AAC.1
MASKSAQAPQEHMLGGVAAGGHGSEGQSRGPHLALAHQSCGDRGLEAPKGSRVDGCDFASVNGHGDDLSPHQAALGGEGHRQTAHVPGGGRGTNKTGSQGGSDRPQRSVKMRSQIAQVPHGLDSDAIWSPSKVAEPPTRAFAASRENGLAGLGFPPNTSEVPECLVERV